ncbi:hypothetical protein D3C75_574730 [compost metagenome]
MQDLTTKILELLKEYDVEPEHILSTLDRVINDVELRIWEKINISPSLLYDLKDTVWYNLEHLPLGGESKGNSDLKYLGAKYPTLMYKTDDIFIKLENIEALLLELEDILSKWTNNLVFVHLLTKSQEGWNGGLENPSPVVIYDPTTESPSKYGYRPYASRPMLIDQNGNPIQSYQQETVLCSIEAKLGTYGKEPLLRQLLERLIRTCKKSLDNKKGIKFEFDKYDYSS